MRDEGARSANELLRKSLHVAFGLGAFTLRWIPWWLAAAVCVAAIGGNWLLLDRMFGRRVARHSRGFDAGVILYPLVVAILIIVFRNRLEIAGTVWAILAFGDGFATIAGKSIRSAKLPWNRDKSWSGFVAFIALGWLGAMAVASFLGAGPTFLPLALIVAIAVVASAIAESLRLHIDDNIAVPFTAAVTLAILMTDTLPLIRIDHEPRVWLLVNTIAAIAGYAMRSVDLSGLIGGWLLGATIIVFAHWWLYVALLVFFVIGTVATKLGYREKEDSGLAQEGGGRRGFGHAFANVGIAAICAIAIAFASDTRTASVLWCAAVAALATAGADSVGTEVGQLLGSWTFLPVTFRRVPRGTEGAISIEGTLAGAIAALVIAASGILPLAKGWVPLPRVAFGWVGMVAACAIAASYIESIAGNWNRGRAERIPNGVLNFFNTVVGAGFALYFLRWP